LNARQKVELRHDHPHLSGMRTANDGTRDRLREIEAELIELAIGETVSSDQEYAEALMHEARRIERNTKTCPANLRRPHH
jgi:hypothetical protein